MASSDTGALKQAPKLKLSGNALTDGYNLMSAGDITAAIKSFATAVKQNPNDISARRYLAYAFYQDGQYAQAANQFKLLEGVEVLNPDDEAKYITSCLSAGRVRDAVIVMERHLQKIPTDVDVRLKLAQLYSDKGARDRAKATLQEGMIATNSASDYKKMKSYLAGLQAKWSGKATTGDIGG